MSVYSPLCCCGIKAHTHTLKKILNLRIIACLVVEKLSSCTDWKSTGTVDKAIRVSQGGPAVMNALIRRESAARAHHLRRPPVYMGLPQTASQQPAQSVSLCFRLCFSLPPSRIGVELITLFHLAQGQTHLASVIKS